MIDLTNIGASMGESPMPTHKPQVSKSNNKEGKTLEGLAQEFATLEDGAYRNFKETEERKKEEFGSSLYDPTDFSALQTNKGFIYNKDKAQEIYDIRKMNGEIPETNDEFVE